MPEDNNKDGVKFSQIACTFVAIFCVVTAAIGSTKTEPRQRILIPALASLGALITYLANEEFEKIQNSDDNSRK